MVLGILQFLKLHFLFYLNTTKFLILWYFLKPIVLLQNYKKCFISKQGLNLIKSGIQAKLGLTNPSIEKSWLGWSFLLK
jgi:hypothetical protein